VVILPKKKKGEILANLSLLKTSVKNYFFFLTLFLTAFLAGAFFLAVAMENHPLFKSHIPREIVPMKIYHCLRIKFFG